MLTAIVTNLNGITIAYAMGLTNSGLALLLAFGVHLDDSQASSITAFVNASLILLAHVSHRVAERNYPEEARPNDV